MSWPLAVVAGIVGLVLMLVAMHYQHLLYRDPAHRLRSTGTNVTRARQALLGLLALAVVVLAFRPEHYDAGPAALTAAFAIALLLIASTDFERRLIPNRIVYPAIVLAAAFAWVWPDRSVMDIALGGGVALGIGTGMFLLGIVTGSLLGVRSTPFGLGDTKLIVLIGLLTGWPAVLSALLFGVVAAGIPALGMILLGRSRQVFAYGPYLVLGALVPLLWPANFV